MNKLPLYGWLLLGLLVLPGCDAAEKKHYEQRQQTLDRNNARYYLTQCVQAIERRRAVLGASEGQLPGQLNGKSCESRLLGDYSLDPTQGNIIKKSVIKLDDSRLSAYTIEVHGRDGELYTYVDRELLPPVQSKLALLRIRRTVEHGQRSRTTPRAILKNQRWRKIRISNFRYWHFDSALHSRHYCPPLAAFPTDRG
ncbi:hypothetical protein ACFSC4_21455 [Deinococcus malanensis]|uniref:hypothetical protein n=1 Tax=Deinococcus malanensis TaxID=1706855 RepID=UPI00362AF011